MIEYIIYIEPKKSKREIKKIWKMCLKKDNLWHFNFYEGFIRLKTEKSYPKLDNYISIKKWRWEKKSL